MASISKLFMTLLFITAATSSGPNPSLATSPPPRSTMVTSPSPPSLAATSPPSLVTPPPPPTFGSLFPKKPKNETEEKELDIYTKRLEVHFTFLSVGFLIYTALLQLLRAVDACCYWAYYIRQDEGTLYCIYRCIISGNGNWPESHGLAAAPPRPPPPNTAADADHPPPPPHHDHVVIDILEDGEV